MKGLKNKRGISLIVLVITIIVMIILAAAIILSLNSSDIIGKANEAKTSSDTANKKASASVLLAEYELAVVNGETTKTANEYVKEGLTAQGIDASDMFITEDREILVGLSKVAVAFSEAEVKIGDTVTGYTLSQDASAKTYTTNGKENTWDPDEEIETDPQPATITRDESITWKYFGIDKNGEALIVGSVTSSSPNITLGGKGGYLNGSSTLKTMCKAMYSSTMGTARSMDMDDVTRVLEYTGPRGSYDIWLDDEYEYKTVKTMTAKTINEIAKEKGYDMSNYSSYTPEDGKYIGTYKADTYIIDKIADANDYNTEMTNLVYTGTTSYWLASPCVYACFVDDYAYFGVRYVGSTRVDACSMFISTGDSSYGEYAVRPVVSLSSNVQVAYDGTIVTLS